MLLTDITEAIVTLLNDSPQKWQEEGPYVTAVATLDWIACLENGSDLQVLISPELTQYNIEESQRRTRIITVNTIQYISVNVGKKFQGLPNNNDVAPWTECKQMLNLLQRIVQLIIANPIAGIRIADIEALPVDELQLNLRNFNVSTQIGYEVLDCGHGPDLLE